MNSYFEILLDKIYLITHDYWNYGLTLHKFVQIRTIIITMITENKIIEIFCMANDFCKFFDTMMTKYTLPSTTKRKYHRDSTMSKAGAIAAYCLDYIISLLNQSSNTLSARNIPSFSMVIISLSTKLFFMRSIFDLLPNGYISETS